MDDNISIRGVTNIDGNILAILYIDGNRFFCYNMTIIGEGAALPSVSRREGICQHQRHNKERLINT